MILILGSPEDGCVRETMTQLRQRGHEVLLVPEAQLPSALQIKWELPGPVEPDYLIFDPGVAALPQPRSSRHEEAQFDCGLRIADCGLKSWSLLTSAATVRGRRRQSRLKRTAIEDLTAVLVRLRQSFHADLAAWDDAAYIRVEWSALLYGWLQSLPCRVVNRPRPGAGLRLPEHRVVAEKLRACGLVVPETLVTDSTNSMRRFLTRHRHGVLLSSPSGQRVTWHEPCRDALSFTHTGWKPGPLSQNGPCRLQAVPSGRCGRVFVVGEEVFVAEAELRSLVGAAGESWRRARLPTEVARRCVRLARRLDLDFLELLLVLGEPRPTVLRINDFPEPARCERALEETIMSELAAHLAGDSLRRLRPQVLDTPTPR